jgi:hypothetical protein
VSLHYYTHTNAGAESTTGALFVEYEGRTESTYVKNLESSEVSTYFKNSLTLNLVKEGR